MKMLIRAAGLVALLTAGVVPGASPAVAGASPGGGTRLWASFYQGSNGSAQATAIAGSPDGSKVFVTGSNGNTRPHEYYGTVAYEASTGARLWTASYRGPAGWSEASAIAVSPGGSEVFVTGTTFDNSDTGYGATVAYNTSTGKQLWVARYRGPASYGSAVSLAVSPDGSQVFVTGSAASKAGGYVYATVAYAAATGAMLWVARYGPKSPYASSAPASLEVSPDGSTVFVTGNAITDPGTGAQSWATIAYAAATGTQLWVARYDVRTPQTGFAGALAVSQDGATVFVTGSGASSGSSQPGYATVAYNAATGARRWVASYNGGTGGFAYSVAVSPDGRTVFVTGDSWSPAGYTVYATVAYDAATGAQQWASSYNISTDGSPDQHVVVSPDGSEVFVTGTVVKVFRYGVSQYGTVAYSAATGAQLWANIYPDVSRGADSQGIVASPDGSKVFVAGSVSFRSGEHYATLAYSP